VRIGIEALAVAANNTGGVETYTRELVRALRRLRSRDALVLLARPSLAATEWARGSGIEIATIGIDDDDDERRTWWASQSWVAVTAARRRFDVLHHVTPFACLPWLGAQIVTVHDLISEQFYRDENLRSRPLRTRIRERMLAASLRRARRILVPTRAVRAQLLAAHGVDAARVVVTPEAPRPLGDGADPAALARHGLVAGEYLFTVSRFLPHKNLATLVAAHLRSGSTRTLAIAGVPDFPSYAEPVLDELRARLRSDGARAPVRLLGFVEEAELAALYRGARLFVFPSLAEGFGLPPLEAMSMDTPVLAADTPVHREVLGDAAAYFAATSVEHLAARLVEASEDEPLRAQLRERARAWIARYSWDETARRTLCAYDTACGATDRAARVEA
jgi:alpha-1,3-rhamnosyl/mannosyltransferase